MSGSPRLPTAQSPSHVFIPVRNNVSAPVDSSFVSTQPGQQQQRTVIVRRTPYEEMLRTQHVNRSSTDEDDKRDEWRKQMYREDRLIMSSLEYSLKASSLPTDVISDEDRNVKQLFDWHQLTRLDMQPTKELESTQNVRSPSACLERETNMRQRLETVEQTTRTMYEISYGRLQQEMLMGLIKGSESKPAPVVLPPPPPPPPVTEIIEAVKPKSSTVDNTDLPELTEQEWRLLISADREQLQFHEQRKREQQQCTEAKERTELYNDLLTWHVHLQTIEEEEQLGRLRNTNERNREFMIFSMCGRQLRESCDAERRQSSKRRSRIEHMEVMSRESIVRNHDQLMLKLDYEFYTVRHIHMFHHDIVKIESSCRKAVEVQELLTLGRLSLCSDEGIARRNLLAEEARSRHPLLLDAVETLHRVEYSRLKMIPERVASLEELERASRYHITHDAITTITNIWKSFAAGSHQIREREMHLESCGPSPMSASNSQKQTIPQQNHYFGGMPYATTPTISPSNAAASQRIPMFLPPPDYVMTPMSSKVPSRPSSYPQPNQPPQWVPKPPTDTAPTGPKTNRYQDIAVHNPSSGTQTMIRAVEPPHRQHPAYYTHNPSRSPWHPALPDPSRPQHSNVNSLWLAESLDGIPI